MKWSRKISGLAAVLLAVLLFATLGLSEETTQTDFKNASWQMVDSDRSPGSMYIGTNDDTQGPVAYYRLDETSGSVIDSAGSNDGTTSGGVTRGATGVYGSNAFSFDGTDDYVSSGNFLSNEFTLSGWIKTGSTNHDVIASTYYDYSTSQHGLRVQIDDNGDLRTAYGDGTDGINVVTNLNLNDGNWHHLTVYVNSNSGEVKHYVNGSLVDQNLSAPTLNIDHGDFWIGHSENYISSYPERGFNGTIDEMRIFDKALSSSQIKAMYEDTSRWSSRVMDSQRDKNEWLNAEWNGSQPSGTDVKARVLSSDGFITYPSTGSVTDTTLSQWRTIGSKAYDYLDYRTSSLGLLNASMRGLSFDDDSQTPDVWYSFEGVSSSVKDFSSTSNSGNIGSATRQDGYSGKAAYFDGSSNFTNPSSGTALTNPAGTIWLEMWVNPENLAGTKTLVDKNNEFKLSLENNGEIWFRTYSSNNQGAGNISENEWSHIAVKWDAGNSITTYVNGTEVGSRLVNDTSSDTGNTVYFGSAFDGTQGFTGHIDEFRAYRNTSSINFLTNISDFTSPAKSYGEKVGPIDEDYVQIRHRPESMNSYSVGQTRVGINSTFGDWRNSGEDLSQTPKNRYGLTQLNFSSDSITNSPRVDSFRLNAAIPDNVTLTSTAQQNVTGDHAYDIEFVVNDPDGDFDVDTCSISASDGDGNSFSASADKDTSYGSSTEVLCTYSSISDSTTGFEVNEVIDFDVNVTDSAGQTDGNQSQQIIPNRKPTVTLDAPEAGAVVTSPVDLSWTGSDDDGDSLSYNITVATDSSLNDVVHTETTSVESVEVSGLSEGDYYWGIEADDSYSTVDSSVRNFTVSATIENVSITLEGDFDQVDADGEQISTGTYTDLSYPYIAMSDSTGLQGLVSYGSFVEVEYSTNNGRDKIRMKQKFSGERMLLVANNGDAQNLEERREVVNSKELLDLPKASFTGRIPDESIITALLSYTDIDLVGNETISPTGNTEILIRNEGTESGKVQVRIAER